MIEPDLMLQRACVSSRFVTESLQRDASIAAHCAGPPREPGSIASAAHALLAVCQEPASLESALRLLRRREMVRIAARALGGAAPLAETLADTSELADACCSVAVQWCSRVLAQRHGSPRDAQGQPAHPVVLGMGKLGGGELNFSSDIDLIFFHTAEGETDGPASIENERWFVRLAQDVGKLLSANTEHGFVFRVDTMLRPFGSAGPMSMGFDAAEDYYQNHGREWERYALIKARPIAGNIEAGNELLRRLRPFVYRRYLDYNALGSLRELKRRIHDDVVARRVTDDVKLGPGGIREVEFIVQSFQLVRGGHDARLRDPRLRVVLARLGELGLMAPETVQSLESAYEFLRRLENAIQMYADQQTHRLPSDPEAQAALCRAMDCADWSGLRGRYEQVARGVNEEFRRVFADPGAAATAETSALAAVVQAAQSPAIDGPALQRELIAAGIGDAGESLAQRLIDLLRGRLARGLSEAANLRLRRVLVRMLEMGLSLQASAQTLERALTVVQAVTGRSTYLALLDESATARSHLLRLCAASRWVAEQITASPGVLDALIDSRVLFAPPGREAMHAELAQRLAQVDVADTEAGMDLLRRYRNEVTVRIAAADIAGSLPLVKVSDQLTWLAEAVLTAGLRRASEELQAQYGTVPALHGGAAQLGALAYGKFGGIELGYGSDLDLVFVHDPVAPDAESEGGTRALAAPAYFARLAQRVIHWLATLTPAGRAYEIDMELRPSGQSGAVAVSLAAYARYQREQAWTWEHQALTRARFVCGSPALEQGFAELRREVLCRVREPGKLAHEIVEMRQKMRTHLEKRSAERWDLKQGEGGVIDCEFLTQYLVLRDAHRDAALVFWPDNWRQLDALAAAGSIAQDDKDRLIECYRAYRAFAHACALQSEEAVARASAFAAEREVVRALWRRYVLAQVPAA